MYIYTYILPGLLGGALPSEWKGHVRSAVVFCFRGHGAAEGASTGDWQGWEAATLCCFRWWHLPACWLASRSGTAADGTAWQTSCSHLAPGAPFAKGARWKCYYDPVAAGAALVGGLRLGCPRLGRSTMRLRCVRVCGPGAAAHLCPAVQRSQAFCFEGLGSVKATGTGCPLPGRSSIFMPFWNLVAVSWDF